MIIGPKYKICKRLGSPIFEKCQTRAFALSAERAAATKKKGGHRGGSDYNRQLLEKQKLRLTYGLSERQFANYVATALESRIPQKTLFALLESRLDSVIYRMGLAGTRRMARQLVSHGHITVNGKRVTIPSYKVYAGDAIAVREGSKDSALFANVVDKLKEYTMSSWVSFDAGKNEGTMKEEPAFSEQESPVDISAVFQYYTR